MTFREEYLETLKLVCWHLGNGWKVIQLPAEQANMIRLMNPALKKFIIEIFKSEGRLMIIGKAHDDPSYKGQYCRCTVMPTRAPKQIAGDIRRKLLKDAPARIADKEAYANESATKKSRVELIESALSRLMEIDKERSWSRNYHFIQKESGLRGHVEFVSYNDTFEIGIRNLSADNLLKLAGFMSTLTPD